MSMKFGVLVHILVLRMNTWQKIKFSKFIWRTSAIMKILFLDISQWFIVRLTRNLVCRSRIMLRHRLHDQKTNFANSRWRKAAILENDFIVISQPQIIRFWWNLLCRCMFRFREWSSDEKWKFCIIKMADGRHLEYCNLATSQRIIVRLTPNLVWRNWITHRHTGHVIKVTNFKNSRWRTPAILKMFVIWHILGNKTAKINVVVYLQPITASWHTENSKNDERWYFLWS